MNFTVFNILVGIAGLLALLAIIKPSWPFVAIGLLLVCIALFTKGG